MDTKNSSPKSTKKFNKTAVKKNTAGNKAYTASKVTPKKMHRTTNRGK
jgi:hypothetical protein